MKRIFIAFSILFSIFNLSGQPIQWAVPSITVSTPGINAANPRISMDSNGNVVAVWVENNVVKYRTKLVNGNWGTAASLSSTNASSPSIATDLNGNSTAVWLENGIVKASSKTLNGSWSSATSLSLNGASSPALAIDAAGNAIAAWVTSSSVQTSTRNFGGNWQSRQTITTAGAANPSIAIGGTGSTITAVVAWHQPNSGINVVKASTKSISGSWASPATLSNSKMNAAYTKAAVDPTGNAAVIWYQYAVTGANYSNVVVQSANRLSNGSWTPSITLCQPGIRNPANLVSNLSFDGSGNAIAIWSNSFDDENMVIQSSSSTLNGSWSSPVDIVNGNLYSYSGNLAVSKYGDALTAYMFYNGVDLIIQASESDISGFENDRWSVPVNISQGSKNGSPQVAASASGNTIHAAVIWINSNGTNTSIQATTGVRTLVGSPSNLVVTQNVHNFGVFSEYYNTLSWTASSDPNVVGYVIYRNGQFLQKVPANVSQIIDDNRVQNGSVVYGIASIDAQNAHGQIITVSFP